MRKKPYIALSFLEFKLFLYTKVLLTIAIQIQSVIVGWNIYKITHDPLSLGLIGLVEIIPNFSVTLFAGHFADIYDRKKIVTICLLILFLTSIGLFFSTKNQFLLYFFIGLSGFSRGILGPSLFSIMNDCVPKEHYANSTTWHSTFWQIATMFGAGISGFLFSYWGYSSYLCIAVLLCFSLVFFSFLKIKDREHHQENSKKTFASITEGIQFVFKSQVFLGAISLDLFAVLFGGAVALLPIFASDILKVGPSGLGFLKAAPSFGSFIMAAILVYYPPVKNTGRKMLVSVFGFGLCMIVFAVSKNYLLSLVALALSGAFDNISVVIRGTIMQTMIPSHMKGKVYSVNSIFIGSSNELGAFESGLVARIMGVVPSVIFGGAMTLLVVISTAFMAPKLKNLEFEGCEK